MPGSNTRKFTIDRRQTRTQPREDFAAVFAGAFSDQPATPLDLPIDAIEPSPYQARQEFSDLDDLAESMRTHGFTSRLRVRPHPGIPDRYQLVYGERRLRAARMAGLTIVPCDVAPHSDADLREIGLIENLQRQDLAALEEARAFRVMLDDAGYSIRSLAERIGKSKGYIQNKLDLLRAPADVQAMVNRQADTQSAALVIAQLPTEEQRRPLIEGVVSGALDTRAVREMVKASQTAGAAARHGERARRTSAEQPRSSQRRQTRASERALEQSIQTLRSMTAQLRSTIQHLEPSDRAALLDYVVKEHFSELERLVEDLRQ